VSHKYNPYTFEVFSSTQLYINIKQHHIKRYSLLSLLTFNIYNSSALSATSTPSSVFSLPSPTYSYARTNVSTHSQFCHRGAPCSCLICCSLIVGHFRFCSSCLHFCLSEQFRNGWVEFSSSQNRGKFLPFTPLLNPSVPKSIFQTTSRHCSHFWHSPLSHPIFILQQTSTNFQHFHMYVLRSTCPWICVNSLY
jgi:hypothetical protein